MICDVLQYKSAFGENARMILYIRRGDHGRNIFKIPVSDFCKDIILASIVIVESCPVDARLIAQFPDGDLPDAFVPQQPQKGGMY